MAAICPGDLTTNMLIKGSQAGAEHCRVDPTCTDGQTMYVIISWLYPRYEACLSLDFDYVVGAGSGKPAVCQIIPSIILGAPKLSRS